jgi:DNA-directed RNA polymerase specialized sigma24 family protein
VNEHLSYIRFFSLIGVQATPRVMGEPEPLDLQLLKDGDNNEIRRALRELDLISFARGTVHNIIGSRYPADISTVANDSLRLLLTRSIHSCHSVDSIKPMLATISQRQAINFLNDAFRNRARSLDDELPGIQRRADESEVDPMEILGDLLADGLGLDAFALPRIVDCLLEHAGLTVVEQHLLKEHIIEGCTQAEFAERHGIPLQGIGGRKERLLNTLRAFLAAEFIGPSRQEFLEILRSKRKRRLI